MSILSAYGLLGSDNAALFVNAKNIIGVVTLEKIQA